MMPTAVIMAIAVERAPTSTEVRRSEEERLREASSASTPRIFPSAREETEVMAATTLGIANADATTRRSEARYPSSGLPAIAGAHEATAAANPRSKAIQKSRFFCIKVMYSRLPCAMASTGDTKEASRAGEYADATATPIPITIANNAEDGVSAIEPGRLLTY